MSHIDVIVPYFNRYPLVKDCIQSILQQKDVHVHLYVIDDCSNQQQANLLREYCHNVSLPKQINLYYIYLHKNNGPAYCRNYGAKLGKSPYLSFLDSDDQWEETKLLKQIKFLKDNPNIYYVHTNEKWVKNNVIITPQKKHIKQGGYFIKRLLKSCLISPSSILLKRSFWDNLFPRHFNPAFRVAEDYEFWLRINLLYPAGYIDEKLTIKYAGDWEQLSQTKEIDRNRVLALHRLYRLYAKHPQFQNIKSQWYKEVIYKLNILIKGSIKYKKENKINEYLKWRRVFSRIAKKENILVNLEDPKVD